MQDKIVRFLFSYRNTPQSTTDTAPAQLLMGCKLRSPLDVLKPDLQGRVEREQEHQKQSHDQHSRVRSFQLEELVFMQILVKTHPRQSLVARAYCEPLSHTIHLPDGRTFRGHIDHICKCTKSHSELDHDYYQGLDRLCQEVASITSSNMWAGFRACPHTIKSCLPRVYP